MEIQDIDGRGQFQVPGPLHQVALGDDPHQAAVFSTTGTPPIWRFSRVLDKSAMEVSGVTVRTSVVMISRV